MSFFHHSDRVFHIWHKLNEISDKLDVVLDRLSADFTKEDKAVRETAGQVQKELHRLTPTKPQTKESQ